MHCLRAFIEPNFRFILDYFWIYIRLRLSTEVCSVPVGVFLLDLWEFMLKMLFGDV